MIGMHRATGNTLGGLDHVRQSVADILTTPLDSRVMRRDYGSLVPILIDQPLNRLTQIRLYAAVASALMRWEPRIRLTRLVLQPDPEHIGRATLQLYALWHNPMAPQPGPVEFNILLKGGTP